MLKSSSHFLAGLPYFRYPFCFVDIAGIQYETGLVQRSSWRVAIIFACLQRILLRLRIHDAIPLAVCVALTFLSTHKSSSSSELSSEISTKQRLLSTSRLLLFVPVEVSVVVLSRVVSQYAVVEFNVGGSCAARAAA